MSYSEDLFSAVEFLLKKDSKDLSQKVQDLLMVGYLDSEISLAKSIAVSTFLGAVFKIDTEIDLEFDYGPE